MGDVVRLRLKAKPSREHAKQWLSSYVTEFPEHLPGDVGPSLFHGWRFVRSADGMVYFANCIEPGISEEEIREYLGGDLQTTET